MRVTLNPERLIGAVSDLVFGSFIENLQKCIYGGVYDPASPVSDASGFRRDVMDAARAMGVTNVRFPGGCYAPYYHWRDGVGPRSDRPLTVYRADGEWPASNEFGTDEFIAWCREINAEPYICVNMGSGTAEEARDWVEYCNAPVGSRWADLRAANGHREPYGVKYWALGNEISAPWEFGYTDTPSEYIRRARDFAIAMKTADPSIKLVISGSHFPIDFPHREWNREVLAALHDVADWVSMHHYIGHDYKDEIVDEWRELGPVETHYRLVEWMRLLEEAFEIVHSDIRLINHEKSSRKPIGIALDEYNPWYKTVGKDDELRESYPLADTLLVAAYFSIFIRHADVATLANMAQLVNTLPAVVVEPGGLRSYRQGISLIQELFLANKGNVAVDSWVDAPTRPGRYFEAVPLVDISATASPDGSRLVANITNRDHLRGYDLQFQLPDAWTLASVHGIGDDDLTAVNTFDTPHRLTIRDLGKTLLIPPASHLVFEFRRDQ